MKIRIACLISFLILGCLISGCTPKARYERMLKHELSSGIRHDSLFMGIYLGMPQKDFFAHCWALNKKGLFMAGENNATVRYQMKDQLKYPASMDFYPQFTEGKISEMPVTYRYTGWGPWAKALSSKNLQLDLLRYYKKIYGTGFITVNNHLYGDAYVKIDGNRRISIYTRDDLNVTVIFTDMLVKKDSVIPSPPSDKNVTDTIKTAEKKQNE